DNDYTYITKLIIPDRAIQETRLVRQGFGRVEYIYTVPRGQELIDAGVKEMTVRATPVRPGPGQPMVYTIPLVSD
ncbi:MAG: hypothetical protein LBN39_11900, partial [Planctomycetaceae bacterium]|nr:hypothetical protein [Planctomycetaceae bacterium]